MTGCCPAVEMPGIEPGSADAPILRAFVVEFHSSPYDAVVPEGIEPYSAGVKVRRTNQYPMGPCTYARINRFTESSDSPRPPA